MTTHEKEVFLPILMKAVSLLGKGCDDYPLPNTDENWCLYEDIGAWNVRLSVEEWRNHHDYQPRPKGETIFFYDWFLMRYLIHLLRDGRI